MTEPHSTVVALVPPLPKGRELSADHRAELHKSGLSDVTIGAAQVYTETSAAKLAEIVRWSKWSLGDALVLPFFVPGRAEPVMYRVKPARPLTETKNGKTKARKYEQPKGVDVMPFFPPNARRTAWYRDLTKPVLWTEGEKKSLLLDQLGYATVGGTGITCFHAKREDQDAPFILHALTREHVALAGREHRIVFDSDAEEKPEIMHAARRLAGMLEAAGAARVLFVRIPHGADGSKLGIDDYFAAYGEDATRALLEQGGPIAGLPPEEVYEALSDVSAFKGAELPKKLRMPWGYSVDRTGCVWKKSDRPDGEDKLIAKAPIVVRRIVLDLYTGEERVELGFKRRGAWKTLLIGREDMLSSRSIVPAVAKHGAPVESGSAAGIVTWLSDLELANDKRLPRTTCVSRCGWHAMPDERVFVAPGLVDTDDQVVFDDRMGASTVAGLGVRGDAQLHLDTLRGIVEQSTAAAVIVFASLAAPMLERLAAPNFAVHLFGDSSRGKSTMLRAAASIFGDPYNHAWVASWNTTQVGLEVRAHILSDLPCCVDEAGVADAHVRTAAVYMLINGVGKARGQKDGGLRSMLGWRTTVLSTGERELVPDDANTGAQIRVLQAPVDGIGNWGAVDVDGFNAIVRDHHGHVGAAWLAKLGALTEDQWDDLRDESRVLARQIAAHGGGGGIRARQADYIATLMVCERLAHRLLGLGDEIGSYTCALADHELRDTPEVESAAERALGEVSGWIAATLRTGFAKLTDGEVHDSHVRNEVMGYYRDESRPDRPRQLWVLPRALKRVLSEHGHDMSVLREWRQRGWIDAQPQRYDRPQRVGGRLVRVVCLDTETFWGASVPDSGGNYRDD